MAGGQARDGQIGPAEAESGGGKTWLLDELARRCESDGGWVLRGQGRDQAVQRPFHLLDGVVGAVATRARAEPVWAETLRHQLGDQVEAVAAALPPLAAPLGVHAVASLGPEVFGEVRSLRALATLLDALGTPAKPAVVLLDDCQWADDLTIKLLHHWLSHRVTRQGQEDAESRHTGSCWSLRRSVPKRCPPIILCAACRPAPLFA
ncbi:ATP-binding protein [Nitrospira sp. Kam-Ns4a]